MFRILWSFILLLSFNLSAQTVNQAAFAIGTNGNDVATSITKTADGGLCATGYSSCSICPTDLYLFKLDSTYHLEWTKVIGGSNDDYGNSVLQTSDNSIVVTGFTSSYGNGGGGIYLLKVNSAGSLQWSKTIEGQNSYSATETSNKGFAIAGYNSCSHCYTKMYLTNLDSLGNLNWAETIGGSSNDTAYSIITTSDKGFVIAGTTSSFGAGGNDAYIVRLDSTGKIIWSKTIGGTANDEAYSIVQTKDKGFAIAGGTNSFGAGGEDAYIIKLDSLGTVTWTRSVGGTGDDVAKSITQTSTGDYIIAGSTTSPGVGINSPYFIKLDGTGNLKWSKAFLGGTASLNSIVQTHSGNYAASGSTSFFGAGGNDALIVIFDTNGNTCLPYDTTFAITSKDSGRVNTGGIVNSFTPIVSIDTSASDTGGIVTNYCSKGHPTSEINISSEVNRLALFPNPATDNVTLQYYLVNSDKITISIIDITGKILNTFSSAGIIGNNKYTVPVSTLATGMYFVKLSNSSSAVYAKFIKE